MLSSAVAGALLFAWVFAAPTAAQEDITAAQLLEADQTQGRRAFSRCRSCHKLSEGARSSLGPNLWNVFGRQVGTRDDFNYSTALREADFVWTADKLNEWLERPRDFLPGTIMSFSGLPKLEQRIALIAYMMEQTGYTIEAAGGPDANESGGSE